MANCPTHTSPCLLQDLLGHTQISSVLICILQHCVPGKQCNSWPCSRNTKSSMSYGTLLPFPSFWIYFLPALLQSTAFLDCSCLSSKPWSAPSPDPAAASIHSARDSQVCPTGHRRKYTISTWALCSRKLRCQIWKKKYWLFFFSITATSRQEGWEGVQCTEVARFAPHWHVCNLGCNETVIQTQRLFVLQERHYLVNQSLLNGSFGIWRLIGSVQVPPQWAPLGYLDLYADHLICPDLLRK